MKLLALLTFFFFCSAGNVQADDRAGSFFQRPTDRISSSELQTAKLTRKQRLIKLLEWDIEFAEDRLHDYEDRLDRENLSQTRRRIILQKIERTEKWILRLKKKLARVKAHYCHEYNSILRLLITNNSDLRLTFLVLIEENQAAQFGNSVYAKKTATLDLPYHLLKSPGKRNHFFIRSAYDDNRGIDPGSGIETEIHRAIKVVYPRKVLTDDTCYLIRRMRFDNDDFNYDPAKDNLMSFDNWAGIWLCDLAASEDDFILTISGKGLASDMQSTFQNAAYGPGSETYDIDRITADGQAMFGTYTYRDNHPPGVWYGTFKVELGTNRLHITRHDNASDWEGSYYCDRP